MKSWMRKFLVINRYGDVLAVFSNWALEKMGCDPTEAQKIQSFLLGDRAYQLRLWKKVEENEISEELMKRG